MYDEIVTISVGVGKAEKNFEIHKGLLCFYSNFFRAALKGGFAEANSKGFNLPTESPKIFQLFKNWLYTRKFQSGEQSDAQYLDTRTICDIWLFADRREIPLLMNIAVNLFKKNILAKWCLPVKLVPYIYENTTDGSKLRYFIVDTFAYLWDESARQNIDLEFGEDAILDIARTLMARPPLLDKEGYQAKDNCVYHVHEKGVRCNRELNTLVAKLHTALQQE